MSRLRDIREPEPDTADAYGLEGTSEDRWKELLRVRGRSALNALAPTLEEKRARSRELARLRRVATRQREQVINNLETQEEVAQVTEELRETGRELPAAFRQLEERTRTLRQQAEEQPEEDDGEVFEAQAQEEAYEEFKRGIRGDGDNLNQTFFLNALDELSPQELADTVVEMRRPDGMRVYRPAAFVQPRLARVLGLQAIEEAVEGSDVETTDRQLMGAETVVRIIRAGTLGSTERAGGFFSGEIDAGAVKALNTLWGEQKLAKYGLTRRDPNSTATDCLAVALKSHPNYGRLETELGFRRIRTRELRKVAEALDAPITLRVGQKVKRYGAGKPGETVELGLHRGHYFRNDPVELKGGVSIHRLLQHGPPITWEGYERPQRLKKTQSTVFGLLTALEEAGLIQDLGGNQRLVYAHELKGAGAWDPMQIPDPGPGGEYMTKEMKPPKDRRPEAGYTVFYADFETTSDRGSECRPYIACAVSEDGEWKTTARLKKPQHEPRVIGYWLLKAITKGAPEKKEVLIYFHNLRFDAAFIMSHLWGVTRTAVGGKIYEVKGVFEGRRVTVRDTYAFVTMGLAKFPKMFGLKVGKIPDYPYDLYTERNVKELLEAGDRRLQLQDERIPDEFMQEGRADLMGYAAKYCMLDCEVLRQGFNTFREWAADLPVPIHVEGVLSAASLAHRFMLGRGCFDGVYSLGGSARAYASLSVVGGRVMSRRNELVDYKAPSSEKELLDVDATSLYPTAMARLPGYPLGKPTKFLGEPPESDFYIATVLVEGVDRRLNFPTLSHHSSEGLRVWTNDIPESVPLVLNKWQVEDAEKYQGVHFRFVGGLAWREGFNPTIKTAIKELFNRRLELKAKGNPAQQIFKLIMNSSYGKTIQRPKATDSKIFWDTELGALRKAVNLGSCFRSVEELTPARPSKDPKKPAKGQWEIHRYAPTYDHFNLPHVGGLILAESKRVMYEVMVPLDEHILYTDTDSMFVTQEGYDKMPREAIGDELGQFHSDFGFMGVKKPGRVAAPRAIFGGRKIYTAVLTCENQGDAPPEYHTRLKGVPGDTVRYTMKKLDLKTPIDLFQRMMKEPVCFDLLRGGERPRFKCRTTRVEVVADFTRTVGIKHTQSE